jgi:uncharacterized membrane protein YgcG
MGQARLVAMVVTDKHLLFLAQPHLTLVVVVVAYQGGTVGLGGTGGGGDAGLVTHDLGEAGTANTGGGGGGGSWELQWRQGGAGGSGIVIIKYTT